MDEPNSLRMTRFSCAECAWNFEVHDSRIPDDCQPDCPRCHWKTRPKAPDAAKTTPSGETGPNAPQNVRRNEPDYTASPEDSPQELREAAKFGIGIALDGERPDIVAAVERELVVAMGMLGLPGSHSHCDHSIAAAAAWGWLQGRREALRTAGVPLAEEKAT